MDEDLGLGLAPGSAHYRAYVGPPEDYDLVAAMSFGLLTALGLRAHHKLIDIGCGSCRLGRLFIPYLNKGGYYGLEPNRWLVEEGIKREIGDDLVRIKGPTFWFSDRLQGTSNPAFFDFAVAQSIFSHCGQDLVEGHLEDIFIALKPSGVLLATFIIERADTNKHGWVYPDCVAYREESIRRMAKRSGFNFYAVNWAHPRQSWTLFAKPEFDIQWLVGHQLSWNTWLRHSQKQFV